MNDFFILDYVDAGFYYDNNKCKPTTRVLDWDRFFEYFFDADEDFFKSNYGRTAGVYVIDNYYVGRSIKLRNRLKNHVLSALNGRHDNYKLANRLISKIAAGEKMSLEVVSHNPDDEYIVCKNLLDKGYSLANVIHNTRGYINKNLSCPKCCNKMKFKKVWHCKMCDIDWKITEC